MKRYLEFVGQDTSRGVENSSKFWEAWVEAETLHTRFGKIGATGQTTIKAFPSPTEAELALDKAVTAKVKKGYVEKVGEEASVGEAARDKNRQEWRANITGGGAGADVSEDVKKKLEELKESGL